MNGATLEVNRSDAAEFRSLQGEFLRLGKAGVVAYMPMEAKKGLITIRIESSSAGAPVSTVVKQVSITRERLQSLSQQAGQPLGSAARASLRSSLLPPDRSIDEGKTVLLVDNAYYGLLPEALEFDGGAIFSSTNLGQALKNLAYLREAKIRPDEFTAFVGYPETEEDIKAVFKDEKTARLSTWKQRAADVRNLKAEFGFTLYGSSELNKLPTKQAVLKQIEDLKGIIWITAHAGGCRIRLSAGEAVEISANDIASLHLSKHPFVIVRACNGSEAGFAKAFMHAGASAVWVNEGKILASEVNSQLRQFFSTAKNGTVSEAIQAVRHTSPQAAHGTGLHVELLTREPRHDE